MAEPTRLDIINKLNTLTDLNKAETFVAINDYVTNMGSKNVEKILNDLESYPEYASKS